MMKVKIVRIIGRLNIGGPARNVVLLSEGFPGTVLVCGEVGEAEGDMTYLAKEKGLKPIVIKELGREISWKDDFAALWKIYKILCREKPDIVHTHTAKAGAVGRMAALLYNLRMVLDCALGVGSELRSNNIESNSIESKSIGIGGGGSCRIVHTFHGHVFSGYFGRVKTLFFIWIERILALFTDKIVTVSEGLKKELVEKYKIAPERKFSVVELGLELEELLKLPPKENSETINIGIVGRLAPVKNHKMLFRVMKKLTAYPSTSLGAGSLKLKAVIIGDGEMRDELGNYAGELGIEDIVEFRGWIRDLKAIYEGLDIVALTSLNEGTPVSIIEAMAAARPVVATIVGGVPDIVQDGKNGYLVESGDEEDFTQKLLDLIRDPDKRKSFGQNGRFIVKERFSKERLINDMEKLYNTILSKK